MIRRPALRYHGGKFTLGKWIISVFPKHRVYVEPYGGAASVLLQKPRAYAEVYNDLDSEVVNLFQVLRCPARAGELEELLKLTPYSRQEFDAAFVPVPADYDPVEKARRTIIKSFMGFGSVGVTGAYKTGFRNNATRSYTHPAMDWADYPNHLWMLTERLQGVIIESRPALDVIKTFDGPETLFYLDPPYVFDTRQKNNAGKAYRFEMTDDEHRQLAELVYTLEGKVIISGYASDLYDQELYPNWKRLTRQAWVRANERTEVLWLSPNIDLIAELPLFAHVTS